MEQQNEVCRILYGDTNPYESATYWDCHICPVVNCSLRKGKGIPEILYSVNMFLFILIIIAILIWFII